MRQSNKWIPIIALIVVVGILGAFFLGKSASSSDAKDNDPKESTEQVANQQEVAAQPIATLAPEPTLEPTSEPLTAPTTMPETEPMATTHTADPDVRYIVGVNGACFLRKEQDESTDDWNRLGTIPAGTPVRLVYWCNDKWSYVAYGAKKGYVLNKFLSLNPFADNSWTWAHGCTNGSIEAITTTPEGSYYGKTFAGNYVEGYYSWDGYYITIGDEKYERIGDVYVSVNTYDNINPGFRMTIEPLSYGDFKALTGLE